MANHPRRDEVTGCLVELDPELADAASANLRSIDSPLVVRCGDASDPDMFIDMAPADVLLLVGVFGNITDPDVQCLISAVRVGSVAERVVESADELGSAAAPDAQFVETNSKVGQRVEEFIEAVWEGVLQHDVGVTSHTHLIAGRELQGRVSNDPARVDRLALDGLLRLYLIDPVTHGADRSREDRRESGSTPRTVAAMLLRRTLAVVALVAAVVGCSSSRDVGTIGAVDEATTPSNPDAATGEWWSRSSNAVFYLSWTQGAGGELVGTLQFARAADDGLSVTANPYAFTGVVAEGRLSLTVSGAGTWTGSVEGPNLRIAYPGSTGELNEVLFVPGTADDYNLALSELQSSVGFNIDAATEASVQQGEVDRRMALFSNVRNATNNLESAIASVDYTALNAAVDLVGVDADAVRALGRDGDEVPMRSAPWTTTCRALITRRRGCRPPSTT